MPVVSLACSPAKASDVARHAPLRKSRHRARHGWSNRGEGSVPSPRVEAPEGAALLPSIHGTGSSAEPAPGCVPVQSRGPAKSVVLGMLPSCSSCCWQLLKLCGQRCRCRGVVLYVRRSQMEETLGHKPFHVEDGALEPEEFQQSCWCNSRRRWRARRLRGREELALKRAILPRRDEEDVIPEDSSELPTEDMVDTSANEYENENSMDGDGGSTDNDSEDDPDWEQDEFNSSKQKHIRTEPGDGVTKSEKATAKGSGHDSDNRKGNQGTGNGCTGEHSNLMKRMFSCVDGGTSQARSTRQKTGEKNVVVVEKTAVDTTGSPLHVEGRPGSSGPRICDDLRPFKVKEEMEKMPVIDLCTPTSSESDCVVLTRLGNPASSSVDGPERDS